MDVAIGLRGNIMSRFEEISMFAAMVGAQVFAISAFFIH
jgi:hypothetical protein